MSLAAECTIPWRGAWSKLNGCVLQIRCFPMSAERAGELRSVAVSDAGGAWPPPMSTVNTHHEAMSLYVGSDFIF